MTSEQLQAAAEEAVKDFPPLPDEVVAKVGALLRTDTDGATPTRLKGEREAA